MRAKIAGGLLTGKVPIPEWKKSQNSYDWLGEGIYFWEHSPTRALRWATEHFRRRAAVIGAVIQLGTCFDLLDEKGNDAAFAELPEVCGIFRSHWQSIARESRCRQKASRSGLCSHQ